EAEAWMRLAVPLPENRLPEEEFRKRYLAIRSQLTVKTPWQLPTHDLVKLIDPKGLPAITWIARNQTPGKSATRILQNAPAGKIRFADEASSRGLEHTCDLAPQTSDDGHWIYQTVGGGIGVIDYDLDGWPDVAAARLNGQPMRSDSSPNRLFRNCDGFFQDKSSMSEYHDTGFSHGIAVGDYNSDGFPDIYDANFGLNRLYRNNGDGTFSDVSGAVGLTEEHWTTSAAIADIDGDALADIFETAYCLGKASVEQACRNESGRMLTCSPLKLPPQSDSIFSGTNSGGLINQSGSWADQSSPGRGLGLILGQLDNQAGLDVFVANDMTANHFWSGKKGDDGFTMADLGVLSGVAVSGSSLSQASMGMAAADPDGDGDIDFFLTHFMDDHNTYYEQVRPGVWVDRSYQSGLSEPSMKLLGFGTEWIDFDNNGTVELIVANGHVDDFRKAEIPYRMPTQVFSLGRDGRWSEMQAAELGDYFQKLHVGRAIANLDVNRDGLTDVAVSHLEEPVALLINQSETSGRSTNLIFKSTTGHRDAISTSVTATLGDRTVTHQLLAGDGYMCSNERRITIGSGSANQIDDLRVTWPSGVEESMGSISTGSDYLIVEGISGAFELSTPQSEASPGE
ncbi:MAG: CRTAC1 family protein, partial [Rubripirellula sp.]